jgi:hypothetical protein
LLSCPLKSWKKSARLQRFLKTKKEKKSIENIWLLKRGSLEALAPEEIFSWYDFGYQVASLLKAPRTWNFLNASQKLQRTVKELKKKKYERFLKKICEK